MIILSGDHLYQMDYNLMLDYHKLMGAELTAVVEGFDRFGECWFGRTPLDAPDIDGKVFFTSETPLEIGDHVTIRITDTLDYDLIGEVISK